MSKRMRPAACSPRVSARRMLFVGGIFAPTFMFTSDGAGVTEIQPVVVRQKRIWICASLPALGPQPFALRVRDLLAPCAPRIASACATSLLCNLPRVVAVAGATAQNPGRALVAVHWRSERR